MKVNTATMAQEWSMKYDETHYPDDCFSNDHVRSLYMTAELNNETVDERQLANIRKWSSYEEGKEGTDQSEVGYQEQPNPRLSLASKRHTKRNCFCVLAEAREAVFARGAEKVDGIVPATAGHAWGGVGNPWEVVDAGVGGIEPGVYRLPDSSVGCAAGGEGTAGGAGVPDAGAVRIGLGVVAAATDYCEPVRALTQ